MIGIIIFEFPAFTIKNELFKDNEIPEQLIGHDLHKWLLNHYFPDHIPLDRQHETGLKGYPDYKLIHNSNGEEIFVELKGNDDGLRKEQLKFILKNMTKNKCFIIFHEHLRSEYAQNRFQDIVRKYNEEKIKESSAEF
jgi:hypothetical protein